MEEISDTNDNKNRKCKVLQHCNGDEKMKTLETESSWIEFQGNNNNVNDKAIMKTVNGEIGNVGDRSAETCSNKPATLADTKPALSGDSIRHRNLQMANGDGHVAETINGSSHEPSKAEVKIVNEENSIKPVAASVSSDAIDNNDDQIVVDGTDDSIDTNDTDADEELDDYSTDNISFVSDADFGNNLIDDLSLLENPSEDDVSNVSENVVYQYRGADFEDVRPAADDDNDFLEMDYEPDPASEVEQDINMPSADVNTGFVSPFNPCRYHVHDMVNPNDVISVVPISVSEWLNNHNVDLSGARRPDSNISAPASSRQMEDHLGFIQRANRRLEDVAGPSDYGSNGRATTRGIYYDNTVTLSTKKYTGTIPKVSRIQSQSRSCRPKPTAVPTSPTKSCCKSMPLICLACIENPSYPLRNAGPRNPCDRCFSLQSVTGDIDCNDNNDDAMDQYYPIDGVSTKRSRSFPVVNRHSNRFPECIKLLRSSLRAPSNLRCSPGRGDLKDQPSTSKQADTEEAREVAMARFKSHDYATIFSVGFNEKSIVAALRNINVKPNIQILREQFIQQFITDRDIITSMNIPEYLVYMSKRKCDYKTLMNVITAACPHEQLDVQFFSQSTQSEFVPVSVDEILNRVPTNGSLNNIIDIRNMRFHKHNVLGQIVNVLRKYSDMRSDISKENYITVPQYYRSGYVYISRKESTENKKT